MDLTYGAMVTTANIYCVLVRAKSAQEKGGLPHICGNNYATVSYPKSC